MRGGGGGEEVENVFVVEDVESDEAGLGAVD